MIYFGLDWSGQVRVAPAIELTEEQESELTRLVRSKLTSVRLAQRGRIVLLAAQGMQNKDIAEALGVGRVQVGRWRDRYAESGLEGIERDLPRGAPPVNESYRFLHSTAVARKRIKAREQARRAYKQPRPSGADI